MRVIGLSGKAEAGKDSAARFIAMYAPPRTDVRIRAFAGILKVRAKALGWNGAKDTNGRVLLQYIGVRERQDDPGYWVRQLVDELIMDNSPNVLWVITDVRFPNEADAVHALSGVVWRIVRTDAEGVQFVNSLTPEQKAHSSETAMDDYPRFDAIISASNLEFLKPRVCSALADYLYESGD